MIVDVDIGNTRLKWRERDRGGVNAVALTDWSRVIEGWQELGVHKIIVSCVAGVRLRASFTAECLSILNLEPMFVKVQDGALGLKLIYPDSSALGVDRWLAMLASLYSQPGENLIVVSAGTALTVDYVLSGGEHLGGLIMPGIGMSFRALSEGTAQLGQYTAGLDKGLTIGKSTSDCVAAGLSVLYRGALVQASASAPFDCKSFVLAGGDSKTLISLCPAGATVYHRPNLVLDGLGLIN